jgi:Zn-dependent protease
VRQAHRAGQARSQARRQVLHRLRVEALTHTLRDRQSFIVVALLVGAFVLALSRGAITEHVLVYLAVLAPSIILHEVSHGAVAYLFGDPTAKEAGRLTLNPIRHIDPFGTVILPALLLLTSGGAFGYAKPVPVNPRRMRDPRNHGLLVSLAGPGTNIAIAVVVGLVIRVTLTDPELFRAIATPSHAPLRDVLLVDFGFVNVVLAAFNLIPLPPLDGSAVIERLLPARLWPPYLRMRQYTMGVLFIIIFLLPGALSTIFDHALDLWFRILR